MAAAYASGITTDHPFVDGNKRTALVVALAFLELNGLEIDASQEEIYLTFLQLAAGRISEEQLSEWLSTHAIALR
jgi:death-on-curing protein